jgi:replication factor A1
MAEYNEEEPLIKISELNTFSRRVYTIIKVISKTEPREVTSRRDESTHSVCEALVADDTGSIYLTLWDEAIDEVQEDMVLYLKNAYINVFRRSMRLNLGRYGSFDVLDDAPFEDVDLENNLSAKEVEYDRRRRGYNRNRRRRY